MKKTATKRLLLCGMVLPLIFVISGCDKDKKPTSSSESQEQSEVVTTFTVTLSQGEGYVLVGPTTVRQGANYGFSVTINDGYDAKEMVVKCNNQVIEGTDNNYLVNNVQENLNITVEGVYKQSKISLRKTLYRLEKGNITEQDRNPQTYLEGVTGSYRGELCQVGVILDEVNFEEVGTYLITYYLIGHETVTNYATIEVYELPTINDVTLDLSNTYISVVSYNEAGQVHTDFEIEDASGLTLTNDEIKYAPNEGINYFTVSYCRTLSANTTYQYKVVIGEDKIPFNVNVTDVEEAKVVFTTDAGVYGYLASAAMALPSASIKSTSAQNIAFKYLLDNVEINPETTTMDTVGVYNYTIKVFHNNVEKTELQRDYEIHVLNSYDITDDIDMNGSFFFYNNDIFSRYFIGSHTDRVSMVNTDATNKVAYLNGTRFIISTELIQVAKARGYNQMKLTIEADDYDGKAITSIPYVSGGSDEDNFWQKYWNQNNCSGPSRVILDLDNIDLVNYPNWFMQFGFRTDEDGPLDVQVDFAIYNISFGVKPIISTDWRIKNGSGTITETTTIDEYTFQAKVEGVTYDWDHVVYSKVHEMYEAGLTICTVEVTGNNHNVFVYANNEPEISDYQHKIMFGGGKTKLTLTDANTLVAVMTSHENTNCPNNQDEDGTYGKTEDMTIKITFSEPRTPSLLDKMYTDDAWTSTGALVYNFNDGENSTIVADDTWSLLFSTVYAEELYNAGYRTMTATFEITRNKADYLTTVVGGIVTSYKNTEGVYTLSFLLENLKATELRVRTNNQDVSDGDHNTGCTGNGITISNISVTQEEDASILKAQARHRLSRMFYAESNCWNYFHHNGWGNNSWGPNCTQAVFGTLENGQPYFQIQNNFFQDMKLAGYKKFSFHVSVEWTDNGEELGNIALTTGGGHLAWNALYVEYDLVNQADFSLDVTNFLNDMNTSDYVSVQPRGKQGNPGCELRTSIITISNFVFSEE